MRSRAAAAVTSGADAKEDGEDAEEDFLSPEEVKQLASLIRTVVHLNFTHTPLGRMEKICELQKLNDCPHMLAK